MSNALAYVRETPFYGGPGFEAAVGNVIDIENLPDGLVTGTTLLDLSKVPDKDVRSGISLSMLFASRVAAGDPEVDDPESWLASYQTSLGRLGFRLSGSATVRSRLHKMNISVHKSIIPFLTVALGGAGAGPIIFALLQNLSEVDPNAGWITLFDREVRRFGVQEMHFGAAEQRGIDTEIRYVVARLDIELGETRVLFFKVNGNMADFESQTTTITANNSLMAVVEPDLKARLESLVKTYIWDATVG